MMKVQEKLLSDSQGNTRNEFHRDWDHYQVFYHGSLDAALRILTQDLVKELVNSELIDRFYFIRYQLGGPHLRIRWRRRHSGNRELIEKRLEERVREFFRLYPSTDRWSEEKIRQTNVGIQKSEEGPLDHAPVLPDQSWHRSPLGLEVERYGGPNHMEAAMNLFMLSSLRSLSTLQETDRRDRRFQGVIVTELLRSTFAFAVDAQEACRLVDYAAWLLGESFDLCRGQAKTQFFTRRTQLVDLAIQCQENVAETLSCEKRVGTNPVNSDLNAWLDAEYFRLARRYSLNLLEIPKAQRLGALVGHIHMTANRLGAFNSDEAYLSRLAHLAVKEMPSPSKVLLTQPQRKVARQNNPADILQYWVRTFRLEIS